MNRTRRDRVQAIRRISGPDPSARVIEGAAAMRLYSTREREVQATPRVPPVSQVAWDILADAAPTSATPHDLEKP